MIIWNHTIVDNAGLLRRWGSKVFLKLGEFTFKNYVSILWGLTYFVIKIGYKFLSKNLPDIIHRSTFLEIN